MVKRVLLAFAALAAAGMFVVFDAGTSSATVSPACQGTGAFEKSGLTYTAADSGVDEIPRTDDVDWEGSITGPTGEQPYSGKIEVELPPPFGALSIDSWSGTTDATSNSGTKHYDIPGAVPGGVEFSVKGSHTQGGTTCTGSVKVKIKGGSVNAFSLGSLVGTALTGAGLVLAGRAKVGG
jgi:hypothetical protein